MEEPKKEFTEQDMIEFSMECAHSRYGEKTLRNKLNGFQMQKSESQQQKPNHRYLFTSDDNEWVYDKDKVFQVYKMYDKVYCSEVICDAAEFLARGKVPEAKYFVSLEKAFKFIEKEHPDYKKSDFNSERNGMYSWTFEKPEQQKQYPVGILSVKHMGMTDGDILKEYEIEPVHKFVGGHYQTWCKNRLENGGCIIWSVKNGNGVLTVGDKIDTWVFHNQRSVFKIDRFEISEDNRIRLISLPDTIIYVPTEEIRKISPLFQISGKDVMEGDEYWSVAYDKSGWYPMKCVAFEERHKYRDNFLTEKEASEWIEEHRPQYSKAQLREAFEQSRLSHSLVGWKHDSFEDYLKYISLPENKTP